MSTKYKIKFSVPNPTFKSIYYSTSKKVYFFRTKKTDSFGQASSLFIKAFFILSVRIIRGKEKMKKKIPYAPILLPADLDIAVC